MRGSLEIIGLLIWLTGNHCQPPVADCGKDKLLNTNGKIMLEKNKILASGGFTAKAIKVNFCESTTLTAILFEPAYGTVDWRVVWKKVITQSKLGGAQSVIKLETDEIIYIKEEYRLGLYVSESGKNIPVPVQHDPFTGSMVLSETAGAAAKCTTASFDNQGYPKAFYFLFCIKLDCSEASGHNEPVNTKSICALSAQKATGPQGPTVKPGWSAIGAPGSGPSGEVAGPPIARNMTGDKTKPDESSGPSGNSGTGPGAGPGLGPGAGPGTGPAGPTGEQEGHAPGTNSPNVIPTAAEEVRVTVGAPAAKTPKKGPVGPDDNILTTKGTVAGATRWSHSTFTMVLCYAVHILCRLKT